MTFIFLHCLYATPKMTKENELQSVFESFKIKLEHEY